MVSHITVNKKQVTYTLDFDVVEAIEQLRQREKKSTFVNYLLRTSMGLETENNGVEA